MPKLAFTPNLRRHLDVPSGEMPGASVGAVLEEAFKLNPRLRSYILDDQGAVRRHVQIYVNDGVLQDRAKLSDPLAAKDEVFVFQALSGG